MSRFPSLRRHGRGLVAAASLLGPASLAHASPADDAGGGMLLTAPLEVGHVTSGFATRRHPIKKTTHHHKGVDFAAPLGAPVRSVDAGTVAFAGTQNGYGNVIYVEHDGADRTTVYAHLDRIDVRKGDRVAQGDTIGTVGQTGLATGPHLHFEVRENGKAIDPLSLAYDADIRTPEARKQLQLVARALRDPLAGAAPTQTVAHAGNADAQRCVDLLQKASLESLDTDELDFLRQGCVQ
jgi:murein DD-endopeptidase MepM/ murein hydrolase activator NlpD